MKIGIIAIPVDYDNALHFFNCENCLIAQILKRTFPGSYIDAGGISVTIDYKSYDIPRSVRDWVGDQYETNGDSNSPVPKGTMPEWNILIEE